MIKNGPGKIVSMALKNLFMKPATIEYPNGKLHIADNYRGKLTYNAENCTGCGLCVRNCPAGAIKIVNEGTKTDRKMKASLNIGRCIFCGQCVDSCPRGCLSCTQNITLSSLSKDELEVQL